MLRTILFPIWTIPLQMKKNKWSTPHLHKVHHNMIMEGWGEYILSRATSHRAPRFQWLLDTKMEGLIWVVFPQCKWSLQPARSDRTGFCTQLNPSHCSKLNSMEKPASADCPPDSTACCHPLISAFGSHAKINLTHLEREGRPRQYVICRIGTHHNRSALHSYRKLSASRNFVRNENRTIFNVVFLTKGKHFFHTN